MKLGLNIDHIAVLREARKVNDPDPLQALGIAQRSGVDLITIHLREDRRHIHDDDASAIVSLSHLPVNIECATDEKIIKIIKILKPNKATLVPEKREEVTTEGGLNLESGYEKIKNAIQELKASNIEVSLFVEPCKKIIELSKELGADAVELHTGKYANIYAMLYSNISRTRYAPADLDLPAKELEELLANEIEKIKLAAKTAVNLEMKCAAGHGLNYQNVGAIASLDEIDELNIGQSIIARSVFTGLDSAIAEMKALIG